MFAGNYKLEAYFKKGIDHEDENVGFGDGVYG